MAFPQAFVTRFFQLINNRQFTEAQRELQRLKQRIQETEWNDGYYRALQGMFLARKANGNQYAFLSTISENTRAQIEGYRGEFLRHVQDRFHDDFDRGFFSAWSDYTRLLIRTLEELEPRTDSEGQTSIIRYTQLTQKATEH